MNISQMTIEQMVTRWEDRREIQNFMGRYTYSLLLKQEKEIFETYWCKNAPESCLGFNEGYYKGYEAVKGYYEALHRKNQLRTDLIMKDFMVSDKTSEDLYGCGVLEHKPLGNQIIEIAEDGQTAKCFWYVVGKEDEYGKYGPLSYWNFGMYGVDFVWENEQWRIWHLTYAQDIHVCCGESWTEVPKERAVNINYLPLAELSLPELTVSCQVHECYTPKRPFAKSLPLPVEFKTFNETFSYGV